MSVNKSDYDIAAQGIVIVEIEGVKFALQPYVLTLPFAQAIGNILPVRSEPTEDYTQYLNITNDEEVEVKLNYGETLFRKRQKNEEEPTSPSPPSPSPPSPSPPDDDIPY